MKTSTFFLVALTVCAAVAKPGGLRTHEKRLDRPIPNSLIGLLGGNGVIGSLLAENGLLGSLLAVILGPEGMLGGLFGTSATVNVQAMQTILRTQQKGVAVPTPVSERRVILSMVGSGSVVKNGTFGRALATALGPKGLNITTGLNKTATLNGITAKAAANETVAITGSISAGNGLLGGVLAVVLGPEGAVIILEVDESISAGKVPNLAHAMVSGKTREGAKGEEKPFKVELEVLAIFLIQLLKQYEDLGSVN